MTTILDVVSIFSDISSTSTTTTTTLLLLPRARPRWRNLSGWEPDEVGVGELVVLDRAVLDVVADPLAKLLAHLQLLVARGRHRRLEAREDFIPKWNNLQWESRST